MKFTRDPLSKEVVKAARNGKCLHTEGGLILAESDAKDYLFRKFDSYVNDQIRGASILVCGHRGGGKTTAINHAFVDVLNKCNGFTADQNGRQDEPDEPTEIGKRPLLVYLPSATLVEAYDSYDVAQISVETDGVTIDNEILSEKYELGKRLLVAIVESLHKSVTDEIICCLRERGQFDLAAELQVQLNSGYGLNSQGVATFWREALKGKKGSLFFKEPSRDNEEQYVYENVDNLSSL